MVILPSDRLPADPAERVEQLGGYFGDLIPTATLAEVGWQVRLSRSRALDFYVNPALHEGLAWWGPEGRVEDIYKLLRCESGFQLSLDDSWTLYDWSLWLSGRRTRGEATEEVVILHVDDHTDFMAPRVARDGRAWADLITGERRPRGPRVRPPGDRERHDRDWELHGPFPARACQL